MTTTVKVQTTVTVSNYGTMSFTQLHDELHRRLDNADEQFAEVVRIAAQIRDRSLWKPRYRSFEAYLHAVAEERHGRATGRHIYRLVDQIHVCVDISPIGDFSLPEYQTRALAELPTGDERRAAYSGAKAAAAAEGLDTPTGRHVRGAVDASPKPAEIEDPEERKLAQEQRIEEYLEKQEGTPQHRMQRPRMEKFEGHATQIGKLMRSAEPGELLEMMRRGLKVFDDEELVGRLNMLSKADREKVVGAVRRAAEVLVKAE
jgi:hypothetical protein